MPDREPIQKVLDNVPTKKKKDDRLIKHAEVNLEVTTDKYNISPTGIKFQGRLSYEDWFECGLLIRGLDERWQVMKMWLWGDWLQTGQVRFEDQYEQAIEMTGLSLPTLRVFKSVTPQIPEHSRNFPSLRQRHYIVSVREKDDMVRHNLLQAAEDEGLTVAQFERRLPPSRIRESSPPPGTENDKLHEAEVENEQLERQLHLNQLKMSGMSAMNATVESRLLDIETQALAGEVDLDDLATEVRAIREDMVTTVNIISEDDGALSEKVVEAIACWREKRFDDLAEVMEDLVTLVDYRNPIVVEVPPAEEIVPEEIPEWLAK